LDLLPAWLATADISSHPERAGLSPSQRTTLAAPMRSRPPIVVIVLLSSAVLVVASRVTLTLDGDSSGL
jgi:hypothetical protein